DLLEHDLPLGLELVQARVPDHVAHHVEGALEVAIEHARVKRGGLLVCAGVDLRAHGVEDLVDLLGLVARGTAEQHVLEQMRDPRLLRPLGRRTGRDPEAERHRAHAGDALGHDPDARLKRGDAVLARRAQSRSRLWRGRPEPRVPPPEPYPRDWPPSRRRPRSARSRPLLEESRPPPSRGARGPAPVPTPTSSSTDLPATSGSWARRRPMRPRSRSTSTTRTVTSSPRLSTSSTLSTRWPGDTLEMCSSPSVPLASSMKAPKVVVFTTLPTYSSPTSTSFSIIRTRSTSASPSSPLAE